MKKYLINYVHNNIKTISVILLFFVIGLVVGIAIFNFSENSFKNQIISEACETLNLAKQNNFENINVIFNGLILNFGIISVIYFSSLTLIQNVFINIITFIKGIMKGICIPAFISIFGLGNGILAILLLVLIPNLIYLPVYLYLCNNSILFHNNLLEHGFRFYAIFLEIIKIIISLSIIVVSLMLEQISSYALISMYVGG